jgi:hypothetical protein
MTERAAQIVHSLLEEWDALLEDRIDDLVKQYANMKWERRDIENMVRYDPSRNKKYLPWIVKQAATHELDQNDLDALHDGLMEFERLLAIPAFQGSRDILSYDLKSFQEMISQNMEVRSRSEIERKAREAKKTKNVSDYENKAGVRSVGASGDLEVLEIKNAESLAWWAWRGYMEENPNWGRPTIQPPPPGTEVSIRDGKWCVRNTTHGTNYLRTEPFYLVLKKGWPYVGILLAQGQVKDLDNDQVSMGVAEEIFPLMSPLITAHKASGKTLGWEARIFENMRFVSGGVEPGEQFREEIDLSGSSLSSLPPNCTFHDSLDVSNTPLKELPEGTVVKRNFVARNSALETVSQNVSIEGRVDLSGSKITKVPGGIAPDTLNIANTAVSELPEGLKVDTLNIEGTKITKLPDSLVVEKSMTWSEPLDISECKMLFFRMNLDKLEREFRAHPKIVGLLPVAADKKWEVFKKQLVQYYLTDKVIEGHVKSIYTYRKPGVQTQESLVEGTRFVAAAMRHKKTGTVAQGFNHTDAMEELTSTLRDDGIWKITFDQLEAMPDARRNKFWEQCEPGFVDGTGEFYTTAQAQELDNITHGEEIAVRNKA